jgi:hypothetical protein
MVLRPSDTILGPARGEAGDAAAFAERTTRKLPDNVLQDAVDYVMEVYRLAPLVGIDPAIVIAQSAHETGNWTSDPWKKWLNPAGLGITAKGQDPGYRWKSGTDAARAQIAHLIAYTLGGKWVGKWPDTLQAPAWHDPRWQSVIDAGWDGTVETIDDLTGRWATDVNYAEKIAARGNLIFPDLPNQKEDTPVGTTTVRIDSVYTTRSYGVLDGPRLWITVHNNGNPNSDRFDEARFVARGGGEHEVLYHAAADEGGVCAIAALDVKGRHAGNIQGNNTSIAIEMCVGAEPWDAVRENTAQWLAEVVTNSRGELYYGRYGPKNFSLDRVREHRDWPGANPACPQKLIQTDGGVEKVVARARQIVRSITETPTSTTTAPPVAYPPGLDKGVAEWIFGTIKVDGTTYSFNEQGPVSQAWLVYGKARGYTRLVDVWKLGDGREYFVFGGFTLFRANPKSEFRPLGS